MKPRITSEEARNYALAVTACCIGVGAVLLVAWFVRTGCDRQFFC